MTDEHAHCWHSTGVMLTSDPPIDVQACCWCGEQRLISEPRVVMSGHGPHLPNPIGWSGP